MKRSLLNLAGKLLVATPKIKDKNFSKTVIFVTNSGASEVRGVILNRPLNRSVDNTELSLAEPSVLSSPLYYGGPLESEKLTISAWILNKNNPSFEILYNVSEFDIARMDFFTDDIQIRSFLGCATWRPLQLLSEVAAGWWYVVDVCVLFGMKERGEALWRSIVEKTNPNLMLFNDFPEDLKWN